MENKAYINDEFDNQRPDSEGKMDMSTNCGSGCELSSVFTNNNLNSPIQNHLTNDMKKAEAEINAKSETFSNKITLFPQLSAAFICGQLFVCIGVSLGFTSTTLPDMMNSNIQELYFSEEQAVLYASLPRVGAIVGGLSIVSFVIRKGQRVGMLCILPVYVTTWLVITLSSAMLPILIARFIQGMCIGGMSGSIYTYMAEISHQRIRGKLTATLDISRQVGLLYVAVVGSFSIGWRNVALITGLIPSAVGFIGLLFLPNSPRWLITQGRDKEATKALEFYRGKSYDISRESNDIYASLEVSSGETIIQQVKLLKNWSLLKRYVIITSILFISNWNGNISMMVYTVKIFQSVDTKINQYMSSVLITVSRILGAILYAYASDKYGRKPLLQSPVILAGLCVGSLGIYFYAQEQDYILHSLNWIPLVLMLLFTLFTLMSLPVLNLLRNEILPTNFRQLGVNVSYSLFYTSSSLVTYSHPKMVDAFGSHWTFAIYSAVNFVIVFGISYLPETKGKTLEEIDLLFKSK